MLVVLIALGGLVGCGKAHGRQEITGEVKLKGLPLDDGVIQFAPVEGQATGDGAQIVQGKYRIPLDKGLSPGKYRVTIYGGNGTSGAGDATPDRPKGSFKVGKERIPPEYNERSKVVKEVTESGPNVFDFDIK